MITKQLLPIFVLAIEGLALLGCGNQRQVMGNVTQTSNQTVNKIDPVGDASDGAVVPRSTLAGDMAPCTAKGRAAQFVIPNPRQQVLSSGFPMRDY
jgi:hypothetical protein